MRTRATLVGAFTIPTVALVIVLVTLAGCTTAPSTRASRPAQVVYQTSSSHAGRMADQDREAIADWVHAPAANPRPAYCGSYGPDLDALADALRRANDSSDQVARAGALRDVERRQRELLDRLELDRLTRTRQAVEFHPDLRVPATPHLLESPQSQRGWEMPRLFEPPRNLGMPMPKGPMRRR